MKIETLHLENFKKFRKASLKLHPQWTLLVGENGCGKTTWLDALAVALGIWLVKPPDPELRNSGRSLLRSEIHLAARREGDRTLFQPITPATITAVGTLQGQPLQWTRENLHGGSTSNKKSKIALEKIQNIYREDLEGHRQVCPIFVYYGAGRAWLPSNERKQTKTHLNGPARRWDAFYDCFQERIRFSEVQTWFLKEMIASAHLKQMRPGFEIVKRAILSCIPDTDDAWFDSDLDQIVLSIHGQPQPFHNLSAGQGMMLAMVADLAIKAITQNAHLIPPSMHGASEDHLDQVLRQTPGIVLIDELDVHLHPRWQRNIAADLKRTFPSLQFIATSHSPQVIGELPRDQVVLIQDDKNFHPSVALGADSNWILDHVMKGAHSQNQRSAFLQNAVELALDDGDLPAAKEHLQQLKALLQEDTAATVGLEAALATLERLNRSKTSRRGPP